VLTADLLKFFVSKGFGKKQKIAYDQTSAYEILADSLQKFRTELKYENLSFYNGRNITEIVELNDITISITRDLEKAKNFIEQESEMVDLPIINNILSLCQFILTQKIKDMPLNKAAGSVTQ
jgi:hypothetical protein